MKVNFLKCAGGVLTPASDIEAERMNRIKTGLICEIDIKGGEKRNRGFHGKVFKFMSFCFEHWSASGTAYANQCEAAQFDSFRKDLTIQAGYYDVVSDLSGNVKAVARSLAYDSMEQEDFEQCYSALINAAIATVFQGADDDTCHKLQSFF